MKGFHVITGLPRSGSTLLCNVLNQNPEFHASSTSILPALLNGVSLSCSNSPEFKSLLHHEGSERLYSALRGLIFGWYGAGKTNFDKSRLWAHNALLLNKLFPEAHIFVCVRDLRAVFASVEKHHISDPALDEAANIIQKTLASRADSMFSPQGLIGGPLSGIEDLLRRKPKNVTIIRYEQFVKTPQLVMERIYGEIEQEYYKHDFEDVQNTAYDLDAIYLNKYPHNGSGRVEERPNEWKDYVTEDIAGEVMQRFSTYNRAMGYA